MLGTDIKVLFGVIKLSWGVRLASMGYSVVASTSFYSGEKAAEWGSSLGLRAHCLLID